MNYRDKFIPVCSRLRGASFRRIARAQRGFTLIELMIVISIILILIGMAVGMYQRSLQHAREAV